MREIKHLSVHQWLRSAIRDSQQPISPIGFLFLKLPPPPCAVLLVLLKVSQQHEIDIGVLLTAWQSVFGKMFFFWRVPSVTGTGTCIPKKDMPLKSIGYFRGDADVGLAMEGTLGSCWRSNGMAQS